MEHGFEFQKEEWDWVDRMDRLKDGFTNLDKITDKWGFIRQIYMESLPMIMDRAKADKITPINPYPVDWSQYFSPIEEIAWSSIRKHYIALYPQFPVFNHFIDFANPYMRIGVELDGKDYHDQKKDAIRDAMLWRYGWRIFRIKGSECFVPYKERDQIEDEYRNYHQDEQTKRDELHHWITNTMDGVIYAVKRVYFQEPQDSHRYYSCLQTLEEHRGAEFPIVDHLQ